MLNQLFNFHHTQLFIVACSGGVDSMAVCDFYHRGNKNFKLAYFNHATPQADKMQEAVVKWAKNNKREVYLGQLSSQKPKSQSQEEWWRQERYSWFSSLPENDIITCHHLDDAVETYLFNVFNGKEWYLPVVRRITKSETWSKGFSVYRPFLTNRKQDMIDWCVKHQVKWEEDLSNQDLHHPRNRIRKEILPQVLMVNPGLHTVIKKKILNDVNNYKFQG